jgi:glycosyltransferase involved in cell wall biosynthesis
MIEETAGLYEALVAEVGTPAIGRRLRVLHVLGASRIGGTEMSVLRLLEGMPDAIVSEVCLLSGPGPVSDRLGEIGVFVSHLPMTGAIDIARACARFTVLLRRGRFDIVHGYGLRANLLARLCARAAGVPCVVGGLRSLHPSDGKRRLDLWLDRLTFRLSAGYVSNSHAAIERLVSCGFPRSRFWLIRSGIELDLPRRVSAIGREVLRKKHDLPMDQVVLVSTANLRPEKDHVTLLQAFACLVERGILALLVLVGDGSRRSELESLARTLEVVDRVRFLGSVSNEHVFELSAVADIGVLSSHIEGLPMSLIEAMAVGLPVVATDVGGVSEVVDDGVTGLLVPPGDVEVLAGALERLIVDPETRRVMAAAARRQVEERFSLSRTVHEHERLYRGLTDIDNGTEAGGSR